MNYDQYTSEMKEKLKCIAKYYEREIFTHKKVLYADDLVQFKKLEDSSLH